MSSIKSAKSNASRYINAGSVSVDEMGNVDMGFGTKPMGKFTFESDEVNEYGDKRRYTRLFHLHTHPKSAVSQAVKKWCDRDLADEQESAGEVDWQSFVNRKACLKLEPGAVKNGKQFENIAEILEVCEDEEVTICEPQENS